MTRKISHEALLALVLASCLRWIARGKIPTGIRLAEEVPGYSEVTLVACRRELRDRGLVDWSHLGDRELESCGLPTRTEADRDVIGERARLVRLHIDPDSGLPLGPGGGAS